MSRHSNQMRRILTSTTAPSGSLRKCLYNSRNPSRWIVCMDTCVVISRCPVFLRSEVPMSDSSICKEQDWIRLIKHKPTENFNSNHCFTKTSKQFFTALLNQVYAGKFCNRSAMGYFFCFWSGYNSNKIQNISTKAKRANFTCSSSQI